MIRKVLLLVLVGALTLPLTAAGAAPRARSVDWTDLKHAWAPCLPYDGLPAESDLCSTDDGGRTWRSIFSCCNFIFGFARTSATSGVVESGYRAAGTFWTRNNGARWYTLPNVPGQDFLAGARALVFAGRGSLLFWAQNVSVGTEGTLNQITGWPATVDPPCRPAPDSGICLLSPEESPFESREVATVHGLVEGMRIVPGGVATLLNPAAVDETLSVLVYRDGAARTTQLPDPPVARSPLATVAFAAAWPRLFVERGAFDAYGVNRADVLWRSTDGGVSWRVQSARVVPRRALATAIGRVGRRVAVPGGWVAPGLGAPTRVVLHVGRLHARWLPSSRDCGGVTRLVVAWPVLYAAAGRASWWSSDGGATWAAAGRC